MSLPEREHPDFPAGAAVRVRPVSPVARPAKLRLAGRTGTVVRSNGSAVLVAFPGEALREHFRPSQLDRLPDP